MASPKLAGLVLLALSVCTTFSPANAQQWVEINREYSSRSGGSFILRNQQIDEFSAIRLSALERPVRVRDILIRFANGESAILPDQIIRPNGPPYIIPLDANSEVIRITADYFSRNPNAVLVVSGQKVRRKSRRVRTPETTVFSDHGVKANKCSGTLDGGLCRGNWYIDVKFPKRFANTPHVLVSPEKVSDQGGCVRGGTDAIVAYPSRITKAGFRLFVSGSPVSGNCGAKGGWRSRGSAGWIAIGVR